MRELADMVADMEVNKVADMEVDKVADEVINMLANMEVDKVANMSCSNLVICRIGRGGRPFLTSSLPPGLRIF